MNEKTPVKDKKGPTHLAKKQKKVTEKTDSLIPKKKMDPKKKKRLIIIVVAVLVLVGAFFAFRACGGGMNGGSGLTFTDTTVLKYGDITDSFSTTGTVESASSMSVYSTLSYTVQSVEVELGDYVEEGQLLCQLDGETIQKQIDTQQAGKSDSQGISSEQIKTAQDNYNAAKYALENGENAGIISAQSQVDNTLVNYNKATDAYNRYRDSLDDGTNATLLQQEAAYHSAKAAAETAQDSYNAAVDDRVNAYNSWRDGEDDLSDARSTLNSLRRARSSIVTMTSQIAEYNAQIAVLQQKIVADPANKAQYEAEIAELNAYISELSAQITSLGGITAVESKLAQQESAAATLESTVRSLENAYDSAVNRVNSAKTSLDNAKEALVLANRQYTSTVNSVDDALADYATAVDTAYESYQTALGSLQSAKTAAQNQLQSYANALGSAKAGASTGTADVNIRNLRADLSDTSITAPVSGTVTAVYAEVGKSGGGLLFVIEDINDLVIETTVKDYDVATVTVGMPVTIKSDSTGSELFDGAITSVAPAAMKNSYGETDTTAGAVYETEAQVLTSNSGLRIGMSARLNFIVAQEHDVLVAPYEAVYSAGSGEKFILAAEEQKNGKFLLVEIPVTTGMENDIDIVVKGAELKEGMRILNEPDDYIQLVGREIDIAEHRSAMQNMMNMMGG